MFRHFTSLAVAAAVVSAGGGEIPSADGLVAARTRFAEQRFGIFLHWGLYSTYAQGEWLLENAKLDERTYARAMHGFYPSKFNADEWVRIVKDAGAKYLTLTARHHEGFSLWPTKADDGYNIANTPFRRDIVGELAAACRKEGLQFNLYYSLMDWHRPFLPPGFVKSIVRERPVPNESYGAYKRFMLAQLTELCSAYHPGMIWFDGEWSDVEGVDFDWGMDEIYDLVHSYGVLVANNRRAPARPKEDIQAFERDLPGESTYSKAVTVAQDRPLEQCDVIQHDIWGYRIGKTRYRTPKEVVAMICRAAAKDSNLLMNVGPDGSGQFPAKAVEILSAVGKWMRANGEAIYGTRGAGLLKNADGTMTAKTVKGDRAFSLAIRSDEFPVVVEHSVGVAE